MALWMIKHITDNKLDGHREHYEWCGYRRPGYGPLFFRTRQEARDANEAWHGYIKRRPDLRTEPHGWKMPRVVKVEIEINECVK